MGNTNTGTVRCGARACAFDPDIDLHKIEHPCFRTTTGILKDPLFLLQMKDSQFTECAVWGRPHESLPLETNAFICRGSFQVAGEPYEALLSAQLIDNKTDPVRLACAYGKTATGIEDAIRNVAMFLCQIEQNCRIVQVQPQGNLTILQGPMLLGDDVPTWTQMKESLTMQQVIAATKENPVTQKGYSLLNNNCRHFSQHMYNSMTGMEWKRMLGVVDDAVFGCRSEQTEKACEIVSAVGTAYGDIPLEDAEATLVI